LSGLTAGNFLSVSPLSGAAVASSAVADDAIASLGASELMLEFVPAAITPHTSVTLGAPTGTSVTVNWVDTLSPNLRGTWVYISEDGGTTYFPVANVTPGTTSATITGLGWASSYPVRLVAYNDGATATASITAATSVGTSATTFTVAGTSVPDSLTGALASLNTNGYAGPTLIELAPGYVTTNDTFPITFGNNPGPGSALTVRPAAGATGLVITRAGAYPTIALNNAKFVTIDGRPGGTGGEDGSGRPLTTNLTINNTFTTAGVQTGTILINNESRRNTVTHVNALGSNPSATSGVVSVVTGTLPVFGSDDNIVKNCMLSSNGAGLAAAGYYLDGSPGVPAGAFRRHQLASGNILRDSDLRDIFLAGTAFAAVRVLGTATEYSILNNRIYQTATRAVSAGIDVQGMRIFGTGPITITGNTIGPNPSGVGPASYTLTSSANRFVGINLLVGACPETVVCSNNTISSITATTTSTGAAANGVFTGINIGNLFGHYTIENNTIGSMTTAGSIAYVAPSGADAYLAGIHAGTSVVGNGGTLNTLRIANNNIGGMAISSASATAIQGVFGIFEASSTSAITNSYNVHTDIIGNTIGSATAPLVSGGTNVTTGSPSVMGIRVEHPSVAAAAGGQLFDLSQSINISSNTIGYLTSNQAVASAGPAGGSVRGISIGVAGSTTHQPLANVAFNNVSNLFGVANQPGTDQLAAVLGIFNASPVTGQSIFDNTVALLAAIPGAGAVGSTMSVVGIQAHGGAGLPAYNVSRNKVHTLDNNSTNAAARITGMNVNSTTGIVENNMVVLGNDFTSSPITEGNLGIAGIRDMGVGTANQFEHNSVAIVGAGVGAGTSNTFAFVRTTPVASGSLSLRNNILSNDRSNGAGTGGHFGTVVDTLANTLMNDNLYYNTGGTNSFVGGVGAAIPIPSPSLGAWQTDSAQEGGSRFGNPGFVSLATANLHIANSDPSIVESLTATAGLTSVDYDGQTRTSFSPSNVDIGADASAFDVTGATLNLASVVGDPTGAAVIPVTATFSQDVVGFAVGDIVFGGTSNPTLTNFAGTSPNYSFDLNPANAGTVTASVAAGTSTDLSGNATSAANFSRNSTVPVELSGFSLE